MRNVLRHLERHKRKGEYHLARSHKLCVCCIMMSKNLRSAGQSDGTSLSKSMDLLPVRNRRRISKTLGSVNKDSTSEKKKHRK